MAFLGSQTPIEKHIKISRFYPVGHQKSIVRKKRHQRLSLHTTSSKKILSKGYGNALISGYFTKRAFSSLRFYVGGRY